MQVKSPYKITKREDLRPGQFVVVKVNQVMTPAIVYNGTDDYLRVLPLAGACAGQPTSITPDSIYMELKGAELKLPLEHEAYVSYHQKSAEARVVVTGSGTYFLQEYPDRIGGVDVATGKLTMINDLVLAVSGWKIVVDGFDGVFAEG